MLFRSGTLKEVRLKFGVRRRAGEVAREEVEGVDERRVQVWGGGVEEGRLEAADVHVEYALIAVLDEYIEAMGQTGGRMPTHAREASSQ